MVYYRYCTINKLQKNSFVNSNAHAVPVYLINLR